MLEKAKDILTNFFLISLLILASLMRISFINAAYWLAMLLGLYYFLAYKGDALNYFDKEIGRSAAYKSKVGYGYMVLSYSTLVILAKILFFLSISFSLGEILQQSMVQIVLFSEVIYSQRAGFNEKVNIKIVAYELGLDLLILATSILYVVFISDLKQENGLTENNILQDNNNVAVAVAGAGAGAVGDIPGSDHKDIYAHYKTFFAEKLIAYVLLFLILSMVAIFGITLLNLPFFILYCMMIISLLFDSVKCLDGINKLYTALSFLFLGFHYVKNIHAVQSQNVDKFIGIVDFQSSTSLTYFVLFGISYAISCFVQRYSSCEGNGLVEMKNHIHQAFLNSMEEKKIIKENLILYRVISFVKNLLFKICHICYTITLLLWILIHVCVIFFVNFITLLLGFNKSRSMFNHKYIKCSFLIGLTYLFLQFLFNINGLFLYSNTIHVYKLLEVIGISKYYKHQLDEDYSNDKTLNETVDAKLLGLSTDVIIMNILFIFSLSALKMERKAQKGGGDVGVEGERVQVESEWKSFCIEKSYILCAIILLLCSLVKFDAVHLIYFIFFILLLSFAEKHFITMWEIALVGNKVVIIVLLYCWNILAVNILHLDKQSSSNPNSDTLLSYLGLTVNQNSLFLYEYWEHILLFVFGHIQQYIVLTYYKKGNNILIGERIFKMPECTRLLFLVLTLLTMFILSLIKPYSFQGLIFLSFFLLFACANLFMFSSNFKTGFIKTMINALIFSGIILLIMKYCFNFSFVISYFKETFNLEDSRLNKNESGGASNTSLVEVGSDVLPMADVDFLKIKNFSLQDFELDRVNMNIKIILNALMIINVLILSSFHKFSGEDMKSKLEASSNNNIESSNSNNAQDSINNNFWKILKYFKIFLAQVINLHSCKIMLVTGVFVCVCLESMIGVIIFGVILLSLFLELKSGWRYSFFPLVFISIIVMCFIYMCNVHAFKKWMTKDYEWFGIYNSHSSSVLYDLMPYIVIIFISFLTRISPTFSAYYIETERDQVDQESPSSEHDNSSGNSNSNSSMSHSFLACHPSSDDYEKHVILALSDIWRKVDFFWYLYGFYIVLIIIMLISFIRVNIISLGFMLFAGVQSFGYYIRTEFRTEKEDENKQNLRKIQSGWLFFSAVLAIITFFQYINYMWFPPSWKISKPWEHISFFCSKEGKSIYSSSIHYKNTSDYEYCVSDWKAWLAIDNYGTRDIFYNFLCLFLLLITQKLFTDNEIFHRREFKEKDELDFTITENRKTVPSIVSYISFIYLKSFILIIIITISIIYSYRYTNLIYGGFLFISFYLLFKDAALVKQKNNLWKYVQYYNYLVLVGFTLFQTPFLPCPVNRDGRSYIGLDECVWEENRLYQSYLLYEYPKNRIDALYMMMVQIIGILKLDFRLLIVGNLSLFLIYCAALVQQIIFDHPYQVFVDKFYKREKAINCKSRAFKTVEDTHLQVQNEERSIYNMNIVLFEKLERLENRIKRYSKLWQQTNFAECEDNENLITNDTPESMLKEELQVQIEAKFLSDKKLTGQCFYKHFRDAFEKIRAERYQNFLILQESSMEKDKKREQEEMFIKDMVKEVDILLEKINSEQFIRDKRDLYRENKYGIGIASPIFEEMIQEEGKNMTNLTKKSEIELLSKLFCKQEKEKENENETEIIVPDNNNEIIVQNPKATTENQITLHLETEGNFIPYRRLSRKKSNYNPDEISYYDYFKKKLRKSINKNLLIDLTLSKQKVNLRDLYLPELIIFSVYSHIETIILIFFIIVHCADASIMSMIYPLTYFGYALVEYPFPPKSYWKMITVYSLIIITIKLVYQFPFFCGYPFLSTFNILNDNYCDYYPLSDQEIMEGFEYLIGLRKYNGEYSYPKNAGLLSGIVWDVVILCLLLVMRSLEKSRGVWNFVNISKDFTQVPTFEMKNNNERENQVQEAHEVNHQEQPESIPFSEKFSLFLRRLVPELFSSNPIICKPGYDYYPFSFASLLTILIYTLIFFGSMMGKNDQTITEVLEKQQFSKDIVYTVIALIFLIVADRIIYKMRSIKNDYIIGKYKKKEEDVSKETGTGNEVGSASSKEPVESDADDIYYSNLALIVKVIMHYTLLIVAHILIFITIPRSTHICFYNNTSLILLYLLCCLYFYFSSMQIKYGFPLYTRGQYFAESTRIRNRVAFKIYRNVPFLYELRAILDWTITRTSLDLFQWMKIEDAYANLYEVKCDMEWRNARKLGEDRWLIEKISWGFCFFIGLMIILILPMILFSSFNPNLVENQVLGGKFSIGLELRNPELNEMIYELNLFDIRTLKINKISEVDQYEYLKYYLISNVDDVEERKLQKVKVVNYSPLDWILSPPAMNSLLKHLEKKTNCYIIINWEFRRELPLNNKNILGNKVIKLTGEQVATLRNIIFALKNHQKPEQYHLLIKDAFPKMIRLTSKKYDVMKFDSRHKSPHKETTDIQLQLIKDNERDIYWKLEQIGIKDLPNSPFYNKNDELSFLLLNDDVISSFFGFNSDGSIPFSIISIYVTIVYAVGKFIRFFFDKISQRVIYEEMPYPQPLFELCEGVFIYRNQRDLEKENALNDLLIRIYRSPETLIKITGARVKYLPKENKAEKGN